MTSVLGLAYRILKILNININHKKGLLRGLWVGTPNLENSFTRAPSKTPRTS